MILAPLNDQTCLGSITDVVRELVTARDPQLVTLAHELRSLAGVVRWLRSLPQRDDVGALSDGPKVDACAPPQRLRLPATDPNCVERAALYLALGEFLAPELPRRLATIDTPGGRHTLPVESNKAVVLDPRVPRNCAHAGVDVAAAVPLPTDLPTSATWVSRVAAEPTRALPGGERRMRNGAMALDAVAQGTPVPPHVADDVATVLALAAREAPQWGPAAVHVVERVARAVVELSDATRSVQTALAAPRNGMELRVGRYRLRPAIPEALRAVSRTLGVVATDAVPTLVRFQLAGLGVTPRMLDVFEAELNREGLTLGPLARPAPPPHSFGALSRDALVARHLERAGGA